MNEVILNLIQLLGGLAFFLYGMHVMSSGLERMAGGKLERGLKRMTSNLGMSLLLGAGITIAIQSSSAMTVMLVGLVNSGIMQITQTVGIIMGSNIGTTFTAWLTSMVGIETDNIWMTLLKPENFSLIFALIGIVLIMLSKKQKRRDMGAIFVGFAVLMYGMKLMSGAVSPLAETEGFRSLLTMFRNPLLGVLVGAVFTGIIQSSAASVAALQTIAATGGMTYSMAIPIIMGQNIGTCVTALISSIGVNRNAKKVAVIHMSFNLIGTAIFLLLYFGLGAIVDMPLADQQINGFGIAVVHTVFNVATTLLLLPFHQQLVRIANFVLKDTQDEAEKDGSLLDPRLLATPSVAISACDALAVKMAQTARQSLLLSLDELKKFDAKTADTILHMEQEVDSYEDTLGTYLVQLSAKKLSSEETRRVSKMLHAIGDFERMGDHAVNILSSARELEEKQFVFSDSAKHELQTLIAALKQILELAMQAYTTDDLAAAKQVEPLEQVIDRLVATVKNRHIARLQAGECSVELGFILADLLGNIERVSDHCSNIAVAVISLRHNTFDTHEYLNAVKYEDADFQKRYAQYLDQYRLPVKP